ncbi:DUF4352 domain-containing protein [Clostridium perfringens]|nr:DUF4352 domain-containing protein [Clostridium perfringens]ELU5586806.1 DUF4352 domain-containing protein [Clostridium perfringens]MDU3844478.1 DUF4352 domain-containing protein [Clostridium perfringens]
MSKKVKVIFTILLALLVVGGLSKIFLSKHSSEYAYNIGDTVKIKDQSLIVNSVKTSMGEGNDKPKEGNEFLILNLTLKNNGDSELNYNPYSFQIENAKGEIKDRTFTAIDGKEALDKGILAPGEEVTGTIVVQEPIGAKDLKLNYVPNILKKDVVTVKL